MSAVAVIGAGAAGLIAAAEAAKNGNKVVLIEKNNKVGRKLYITGKGRCNITNSCDLSTLIANTPGNGRFLYSTFSRFGSREIVDYFEDLGVETKVERGNRVFPKSDKAADVVDALYDNIKKLKVKLMLNTSVIKIKCKDEIKTVTCVSDGKRFELEFEKIIIATGGLSYPKTGSTGDGFKFASDMGHSVTELRPSLVPLIAGEKWIRELKGLSLRNVSVKLIQNDNKLFEDFGEMLFTHYGISGPLILSASSHIRGSDFDNMKLMIDLKPALTLEELNNRIKRDFLAHVRKNFSNALNDLLPGKLIPVVVELSGIENNKPVNQITREEREKLTFLLKHFTVTPTGPRPIEEAIITSGGIDIKEIDPKTMESYIVPGIYFAGEIIDVDAYTGGFNLTIAFSTGYTAGNNV